MPHFDVELDSLNSSLLFVLSENWPQIPSMTKQLFLKWPKINWSLKFSCPQRCLDTCNKSTYSVRVCTVPPPNIRTLAAVTSSNINHLQRKNVASVHTPPSTSYSRSDFWNKIFFAEVRAQVILCNNMSIQLLRLALTFSYKFWIRLEFRKNCLQNLNAPGWLNVNRNRPFIRNFII